MSARWKTFSRVRLENQDSWLMLWHILAPEYPPDCGGVGDYTALLAAKLAGAGDLVHVWHPRRPRRESLAQPPARLTVHHLPDCFGRASRRVLERALIETPGTTLVQYVPSAFGLGGANVPFACWLLRTRRRGADVRVMFHEPFFYFGLERPWRNALAVIHRLMAMLMIRASSTSYLSTETWFEYLAPFGPVSAASVLTIPATIATDPSPSLVACWRGRVRDGASTVIGHFGTYGEHVGAELQQLLPAILRMLPHARVLLIGDGSCEFADRLSSIAPDARIAATGRLSSVEVAAALRACDVLIAPFPDGATTRRTSLMAALTSGRAVVTTDGSLTESVWRETGAVALVPVGDATAFAREVKRVAEDEALGAVLGTRARRLYDERFDLAHTVSTLRQAAVAPSIQ